MAAPCRESRSAALRLRTVVQSGLLDFTSEAVIRQMRHDFDVATLPVPELSMHRPVGAICRKETYLPPIVKRMLDTLRSLAADSTPRADVAKPDVAKRRPKAGSKG